ncbi:MAG: DUF4159 domain-containing protein [Pirellulaceae bacterium]|nr:DUF4159 domain-containing protein [Pirellulaceae bacterium]
MILANSARMVCWCPANSRSTSPMFRPLAGFGGGGGEPLMVEKQHSVDGKRGSKVDDRDRIGRDSLSCHYLTRVGESSGKGGTRIFALVTLFSLVVFPAMRHACADVDAVSVQRAIDRGVTYLRKTQSDRGGWEEFSGQSCGTSSLCTLALLNAGVSRDDPDVVRAIRYLRGCEPMETYSVALQTLVYCQLGAAGDLPRIRRNVSWLISQQKKLAAGNRAGGWGYGQGRSGGDPSNTQFALLALGAAQDRGIDVDSEVFARSLNYWLTRQGSGGGWGYGSSMSPSGSMTCAGIASVIIARGRLSDGSSQISGDQIRCCGGADDKEDPVEKGIAWLADSFSLEVNPGGHMGTYYYYLYALERVGRLSGRRFIGKHDWYRAGAEVLLKQQDGFQGFWVGAGWEDDRNITTSFALLFLSKGKRQVVVGQLQHGESASRDWQKHPDAMRQLVRHVERDWGRDLTWQTIQAGRASVEDLLQTPVLIISDHKALTFPVETRGRLKEYLDQGGTILFEADGGDGCGDAVAFEQSVKAMCQEWFDGASLERLPPSHPVWYAQRKVDVNALTNDFWVYGVQACCRTSVFYVPETLSCRWELSDILFRRREVNKAAQTRIETAVRIGQNILAYATGRELKDKLEERALLDGESVASSARGAIRMSLLGLDAGGEEARRAVPNAAAIIRERSKLQLASTEQAVALDPQTLQDVYVLWVHGRTEFQFSPAQREVLRNYVKNGGMILGSAVCGSEAFSQAFREEMREILPDAPLQSMPPTHPAFTTAYDGDDIRRVTLRTPTRDNTGQSILRRATHPVIEMAIVDDVAKVFFSPLDLSCALESQNSVQCPGYSTDDAAKIVGNLVLFALQQ